MTAASILVLAPHPDDEVVACGIAVLRARAAGARVFVMFLTTGVPEPAALWRRQRRRYAALVERRRAEACAAAALLGLEPAGFRDIPARRLRAALTSAEAAVAAAAANCAADMLWVPAFEGGHQDHDAANALAATFAVHLPVQEFAAYNLAGGRARANTFAQVCGDEMVIAATPAEAALKRRALACYASERRNLRHVGWADEACRPLPTYDYAAPPHQGRLFRERFHWLPFAHPRVDFDPSAEVYGDLGRFVSAHRVRSPFGDGRGSQPGQAERELAGALDEANGERGVRRQAGGGGQGDERRLPGTPAARDQESGAARGEAQAFERRRCGASAGIRARAAPSAYKAGLSRRRPRGSP